MSYGLQIETDAGKLLVLDDYSVPWLAGKCTAGTPTAWVVTSGFPYDSRFIPYTIPGVGERMIVTALTEVTDDVWTTGFGLVPTGATTYSVYQFRPTGTTQAPPAIDIYAFRVGAPPTASTGYGLQVFSSAGALTFDSGSRPMSIKGLLSHAIGNTNTTITSPPTKAGFILTEANQHVFVGDIPTSTSVLTYRLAAFRRTTSGLSSKLISQSTEGVDAYYNTTITFGSLLALAVPIINAGFYD